MQYNLLFCGFLFLCFSQPVITCEKSSFFVSSSDEENSRSEFLTVGRFCPKIKVAIPVTCCHVVMCCIPVTAKLFDMDYSLLRSSRYQDILHSFNEKYADSIKREFGSAIEVAILNHGKPIKRNFKIDKSDDLSIRVKF